MSTSTLVRPREGRMIGGVCAGLGRRYNVSATKVRVIFLLSCLLPGPQFLVYLALWALMPAEHRGIPAW
ncbi:PspC domain-containing protein [Streptantibioticus silvisoli]|uniref:PspC domain-containing protein n=1 Tax=Streptantibioticus silvisoli TaxID=2705255 RepID=A0ABT6VXZ3_9ACTN|nr:PspC domain-containing protein [Streptantibioticus silvisoli]MDI5963358.1 PspC domain-containing protein [Streptantibioticus silvisoli]